MRLPQQTLIILFTSLTKVISKPYVQIDDVRIRRDLIDVEITTNQPLDLIPSNKDHEVSKNSKLSSETEKKPALVSPAYGDHILLQHYIKVQNFKKHINMLENILINYDNKIQNGDQISTQESDNLNKLEKKTEQDIRNEDNRMKRTLENMKSLTRQYASASMVKPTVSLLTLDNERTTAKAIRKTIYKNHSRVKRTKKYICTHEHYIVEAVRMHKDWLIKLRGNDQVVAKLKEQEMENYLDDNCISGRLSRRDKLNIRKLGRGYRNKEKESLN